MISVCAICHSRQKSEGVRIAQLEEENAKLKKAVRKYLALINLIRRDVNAEYTALKILEAMTQERSDG